MARIQEILVKRLNSKQNKYVRREEISPNNRAKWDYDEDKNMWYLVDVETNNDLEGEEL